jgi:hypothetical protein
MATVVLGSYRLLFDVSVVFWQSDFECRVNLLREKKEEGQKYGQKGLIMTASLSIPPSKGTFEVSWRGGVQELMDKEEVFNERLEVAIGYAGSVGTSL